MNTQTRSATAKICGVASQSRRSTALRLKAPRRSATTTKSHPARVRSEPLRRPAAFDPSETRVVFDGRHPEWSKRTSVSGRARSLPEQLSCAARAYVQPWPVKSDLGPMECDSQSLQCRSLRFTARGDCNGCQRLDRRYPIKRRTVTETGRSLWREDRTHRKGFKTRLSERARGSSRCTQRPHDPHRRRGLRGEQCFWRPDPDSQFPAGCGPGTSL